MTDRVSVDQVIKHNKISKNIDREFAQEHLNSAISQIDRSLYNSLGTAFVVSTSTYPDLYDEAIKKQAYVYMIPFLHLFYQTEYPDNAQEKAKYYLEPKEQKELIANLNSRITECLAELLEDQTASIDSERVLITPNWTFMSAGGNPNYIPKYRNKEANNDDTK